MVVLATKCYVEGDARERALDSLGSLVDNEIGDLDATADLSLREDDFPVVAIEGPDATAARNVLRAEFGEIGAVEPGETATGTLEAWDEGGFVLDAGQIRTRYGLVQHVPLQFVGGETPRLADSERDRLYEWTRGSGRVNVNSATRAEVRATVNRAGHAHDIVTVERLGLLEQSIICREETDPPGLLASIGEYLPAELLCVVP